MLLKTRREFTLCFFLFAPLGMAGYSAGNLEGSSREGDDISNGAARGGAVVQGTTKKAPKKGGQAAPTASGGGVSAPERVSRLLLDGRRAYRDGEIDSARNLFKQALALDATNEEAQKYLSDIARKGNGAQFNPEASMSSLPAAKPGTLKPVAPILPLFEEKTPALAGDSTGAEGSESAKPAPVKRSVQQELASSQGRVSMNSSVELGAAAPDNRFSKSVTREVAFNAPVISGKRAAAERAAAEKAAAEKAAAEKAAAEKAATEKQAIEKAAADKALAEKAAADKKAAEKAAADAEIAKKAEAKLATEKLVAEKLAAEKAAAEKAAAKKIPSRSTEDANVASKSTGVKKAEMADAGPKTAGMSKKASPITTRTDAASELASEPSHAVAQQAGSEILPGLNLDKEAEAKAPVHIASVAKPAVSSAAGAIEAKTSSSENAVKSGSENAEARVSAAPQPPAPAANAASIPPAAEKKVEEPKAAKSDSAVAKADTDTAAVNAGIKLYNSGKYSEAIEKFAAILKSDALNSEAQQYKERAQKKLEASKGKPAAVGSADSKSKSASGPKGITSEDVKPESAKEIAKPEPVVLAQAPGGEKEPAATPQTLKPLSEALGQSKSSDSDKDKKDSSKPADKKEGTLPALGSGLPGLPDLKSAEEKSSNKPETDSKEKDSKPANTAKKDDAKKPAETPGVEKPKTETAKSETKTADSLPPLPKADDPSVEADKLLRQAQRELQEGKRDAALATAKKAAELDAKNVEIKALVADLTSAMATPKKPADETAAAGGTLPPLSAAAAAPPSGVDSLIAEGRSKFEAGQTREALTSFKAALEIQPDNEVALSFVGKIEQEQQANKGIAISAAHKAQDAESAFMQGLVAYQAGRLDVAVQHWNYALTLDSNHPRAIQYLEQTRPEYDAWVQQHQYNALELQKEVSATEKLDTSVTYDTAGQKSIVEFLSAMSLITDVSFYVADGVDPEIRVTAKFEDQPLHDALDVVLLPIGLKWSRTADVITVTPDLRNKFFNLTPEQVGRLKTVLENKTLQRYLYGPEGAPPMRNQELTLDDRENLLIVTDSQENINKIEAYLKDMQLAGPQGLVYKNWKIRPEEGQKIKALVEAIVKVNSDAAFDLERKVVVDNDDLIVKDTAENVAKIEQLLLDKNFLRKLETQKLGVATYNLTPREPLQDNVEQVRDLAQSIVTVVKTILYSQSTESAAAAEGRRYWFDQNTLQLTVTDLPENLRIVGDYIRSLPMLGSEDKKSEIIFLKHQTASEMQDLLQRVLGLSSSGPAESAGGLGVTKTLRVEGELTFRDLRIRVTKVNENDINDENDDSVELVIRTATSTEDRTIEEFRSEFIDEYELNIIEVRPSGTPGEGSARIEVRLNQNALAATGGLGVPGVAGQTGALSPAGGVAVGPDGLPLAGALPGEVSEAEEEGLQIETIENMNALLIRYEDPGDLAELKTWLEQLDIPVLQVNIETKLVEVFEHRAKEFMPEFNMANIGRGSPDFSNNANFLDFAKNEELGEFRSGFDPYPEDDTAGGLLKGTTVFSIITGGESPINFTLRALESEGVVNMVNGPTVTVENGETADFEIERTFAISANQNVAGGTGGNTGGVGGTVGNTLQQVQLSVSPQITQIGEIRLDIQDLELQDFGGQLPNPQLSFVDEDGSDAYTENEHTMIGGQPTGTFPYDVRRRSLTTVARVRNHGTIVLGGWTGEHSRTNDSGVPILRNLPYVGKLLFGRTSDRIEKTSLLIFLTCHLVEP